MEETPPPPMSAAELAALASDADSARDCAVCGPLNCVGWESMLSRFDKSLLRPLGSLRDPEQAEPTLEEFHPRGTYQWSPDAPIAPAFHPYNQCSVWACTACRRVYLRYTEYGGYYQDERIRLVDPALVVTDAA